MPFEILDPADQLRAYGAACAAHAWVPVAERLPASGATVLACYRNSAGNLRRIRAYWIAAKSSEASSENDFGEYDEATDTYYDPEGWYECIDNWGDYSAVAVCEGDVTHWMHMPAAPDSAHTGHAAGEAQQQAEPAQGGLF